MRRSVLFLLLLAATPRLAAQQSPASPQDVGEAEYHFLAARHFENTGKIDDAIAALRKAMEIEPASAELRAELAGLYARQDRAVDALTAAEAALTIDPANREANRILGTIYAALSEQKQRIRPGDDPATYQAKAIAALEAAMGAPGGDLGLAFMLGRLYARNGQHDKAITALTRVFDEQPAYAEGGMLLAASQEEAGRLEEATRTIEATILHNPTFFRAHIKLIQLYERERRWKDAAGAYALARKVNPRADLAGGHAAALLNSGEARHAQEVAQAAIAARPAADAGLLYLLAESQRQLKDYPGATSTAQKLRAAFPEDPRGHVIEAQLQLAQGHTAEAIAAFAELVRRVPDEPTFVHQYAQLLEQAGRITEAETALRRLLERDPGNANALNALGYMFADRGERLDEAVELLQRALAIDPGNASFLDSLGWAFFKQGRLDRADQPLSEAAAKSPGNSVILDHLGDLRYRQQRFADAMVAWERALAGDVQPLDRPVIEKKLQNARRRAK
jgi:tetratricopeptide (TPR) repeat protein